LKRHRHDHGCATPSAIVEDYVGSERAVEAAKAKINKNLQSKPKNIQVEIMKLKMKAKVGVKTQIESREIIQFQQQRGFTSKYSQKRMFYHDILLNSFLCLSALNGR
jgi:hypothetical protein